MKTPLLFVLLLASFVAAQETLSPKSEAMPSPPTLPIVSMGVCPFEGCIYRHWKATAEVTVFDTWKPKRHRIATLRTGEIVKAETGVSIVRRPDKFILTDDVPALEAKKDALVYLFTDCTEGFWDTWVDGRMYRCVDGGLIGCDAGPKPTHCVSRQLQKRRDEWWALVVRKDGKKGWVLPAGLFDGMDQLGEPEPQ